MHRYLFLTAALALSAGPAFAQDNPPEPKGSAPTILFVDRVEEASGNVMFQRPVSVVVPTQVTEKVIQNGQEVNVARIVYRQQTQISMVAYALKGSTFQTAGGKKLSQEDGLKRLKKGTPVLIGEGGQAVNPLYLRVVNADALVMVAPNSAGGGVGIGIAVPAPVPVPLPAPKVDR